MMSRRAWLAGALAVAVLPGCARRPPLGPAPERERDRGGRVGGAAAGDLDVHLTRVG